MRSLEYENDYWRHPLDVIRFFSVLLYHSLFYFYLKRFDSLLDLLEFPLMRGINFNHPVILLSINVVEIVDVRKCKV
jgi:hypothetical protein